MTILHPSIYLHVEQEAGKLTETARRFEGISAIIATFDRANVVRRAYEWTLERLAASSQPHPSEIP